jgi:hypothetical protein
MESRDWLIWSLEHQAWWCPRGQGYTQNLNEVGCYTQSEAKEICDNANRYSNQIEDIMINFVDAIEEKLERELERDGRDEK